MSDTGERKNRKKRGKKTDSRRKRGPNRSVSSKRLPKLVSENINDSPEFPASSVPLISDDHVILNDDTDGQDQIDTNTNVQSLKAVSRMSLLSIEEFEQLCQRLSKLSHWLKANEQSRGFKHNQSQDIFEAYKDYEQLGILSVTDDVNELRTPEADVRIMLDAMLQTIEYYTSVQREDVNSTLTDSINDILMVNNDLTRPPESILGYSKTRTSKLYEYLSTVVDLMEQANLNKMSNGSQSLYADLNQTPQKHDDLIPSLRELMKQVFYSIRSLIQLPSTAQLDMDDVDMFIDWMPRINGESVKDKDDRKSLVRAYNRILKACDLLMGHLAEEHSFDSHYDKSFNKDNQGVDVEAVDAENQIKEPLSNFRERLDGMDTYIFPLEDVMPDESLLQLTPKVHYLGIRVPSGMFQKTDFICRRVMHAGHQMDQAVIPSFLGAGDQILSQIYEIRVRKPVRTMLVMIGSETSNISNRRKVQIKYKRDAEIMQRISNVERCNAVDAVYGTGEENQNRHFCAAIKLVKNQIQLLLACRSSAVSLQLASNAFGSDTMSMKGIVDTYNPEAEEYRMMSPVHLNNDPLWCPRITILRIYDRLLEQLRLPTNLHSSLEIDGACLVEIDWKTAKKTLSAPVLIAIPNILGMDYIDDGVEPLRPKQTVAIRVANYDPFQGIKATQNTFAPSERITGQMGGDHGLTKSKPKETIVQVPILPAYAEIDVDMLGESGMCEGGDSKTIVSSHQIIHEKSERKKAKKMFTAGKTETKKKIDVTSVGYTIMLFGRKKYYDSKTKTTGYWMNLTDSSKIRFNLASTDVAGNGKAQIGQQPSPILTSNRIVFDVDLPLSPLLLLRAQCQQEELSTAKIDNTRLCQFIMDRAYHNVMHVRVFQRSDTVYYSSAGHYQQSLLIIVCPARMLNDVDKYVRKQAPLFQPVVTDKLEFQLAEMSELVLCLDGNMASAISKEQAEEIEHLEIGLMPGPIRTLFRRIFYMNIFQRFINQIKIDICPINLFGQASYPMEYQGSLHFYVREQTETLLLPDQLTADKSMISKGLKLS